MTLAKRLILWPLAILVLAVLAFFLAAWIGSSIPRNNDWTEPDDGIEIMIETNGIHTAIVMPAVTRQKNWYVDFPPSHVPNAWRDYTHISISWGEREVFLNTPDWSDITLSTALGATVGGDSLLHIAHYVRPADSSDHRALRIRREEYARLVEAIDAHVLPKEDREIHPGYADYDVFYDARGRYHIGNTCNQWTSDMLASAGIKTGLWTPISGGVMKWVPAP